jgi:hypothetical protein
LAGPTHETMASENGLEGRAPMPITASNAPEIAVSEKYLETRKPMLPAKQHSENPISNSGCNGQTLPIRREDTDNQDRQNSQGQLESPVVPVDDNGPITEASSASPVQITPAQEIAPVRKSSPRDSEKPPDLDVLLQRCDDILRTNLRLPDYTPSAPIERTGIISKHLPVEHSERLCQCYPVCYPVEDSHEGRAGRSTTDVNVVCAGMWRPSIEDAAGYPIEQGVKVVQESYHDGSRHVPERYLAEHFSWFGVKSLM